MRIVAELRRSQWSPYAGGIVLGLLVTISMALFGHRLSGAGAYEALAGVPGRWLAPHSFYWRNIVPSALTWDVWVALGTMLGAFVSSRLSRTFRFRTMPDEGWRFGRSVSIRWLVAFSGAALTGVGAGIAGGCTASLVVSGGAVLAPGAFAFMAGMFGGGIPAILVADMIAKRQR